MQKTSATTISGYNKLQTKNAKEICNFLEVQINKSLKRSESKIWHGSPVWFIGGNPIVSYSVRKDGRVSLMFFSGQSFDEAELKAEGKFKAAEIFYTDVKEVKVTHLKRWLKKATTIQWDYKNIVKRKGLLEKIENHSHTAFDNPEMLAKKFDDPKRDAWQKPNEVIKSLNLPKDAVVVEIGAGTGYFIVRLAEHFKNGKVISFDQAPKMVTYLQKRVDDLKLKNVDVRLSKNDTSINLEEKADHIMCVDVYHHIKDRITYFSQLSEHLKNDGKITIIDRPASSPVVPPHSHQTAPELVVKEMEQAGFKLVEELDFLLPYQFYLLFKKIDPN